MTNEESISGDLELVEQFVLLLLDVDNQSEIRGKTLFIKQVFLMAMEIIQEIIEPLEFYPFQIGPYSTVLAKMLNRLIREKFIEAYTENKQWVFKITEKGHIVATMKREDVTEEDITKIEHMKRSTSDLGTNSVLKYVYKNYPGFAIDSRIREVIVNS